MSLAPGTRLGPFEIRSLLGVGGMGEVYRATDSKLGREVALKFLPEAVAGDPARLGRFEREAQTLAALNHPNIAQIYGLHENALVMELLDGATLAARINEGPLPVRKAIDYGVQMARGLAAAHARGVVHRDLKPDNVFVLADGHVKIIDFGLAKGADAPGGGADAHTVTNVAVKTDLGTVMGTVGYMAPEQVRGEAIDARADLFALGAVLYELLSGERAFKRDTAAETMTAILRDDPRDLTMVRPEIPPALERIVRHCLEKNPIERFQTARDIAFALESLSSPSAGSGASVVSAEPPLPAKPSRERRMWLAVSTLLAAVAAWLAVGRGSGTAPAATGSNATAFRAAVLLPKDAWLPSELQAPLRLALSRDSQRIAFTRGSMSGTSSIWEYSVTTGETRLVPASDGGYGPAYGDDGELLFNTGVQLKRVDTQGRVAVLPSLQFGEPVGSDGLLGMIGSPGRWRLVAVRKPGAAPEELYQAVNEGEDFVLPRMVFGQRLFVVQHRPPGLPPQLEIGSFDGGPVTVLLKDATTPFAAAGYLLFARTDRLYAQPLDLEKRVLTGEPTLLAEHLDYSTSTGAAYAATDKAIVYAAASNNGKGRLTLMTRTGATLGTVGDEGDYSNVELSPDGTRVAVSLTTETGRRDIFLVDLVRGVRQRLTSDPSDERSAVWTRDGRSVIYNSKGLEFYRRPSDFSGGETPVLMTKISKDPRDVSPDGTQLLYRSSGAGTSNDVWIAPLSGDGKPHAVIETNANENYASFSPDGKSIVYVSDESGRSEVYAMSLAGGGKVQVSTTGGGFPRWRQPQEIVYLAPDRTLMRVPVTSGTFGTPAPLFKINFLDGPGTPFDVTPDGRFLVNATTPSPQTASLQLIVNWTALLEKARLQGQAK